MRLNPIYLIIALIILASLSTASDYLVDENMDVRGNDVYNGTNSNFTYFYQNGVAVLDVDDNTTMTTYIDAQDVVYNTSMKTYADTIVAALSSVYCALTGYTMAGAINLDNNDIYGGRWINSTNFDGDLESEDVKTPPASCSSGYAMTQFVLNFSTVTCSQFLTVADNTSMKNYVDAQDVVYNDSMKTYVDAQDTTYNTSMKTYVDATNTTMTSYVDALSSVYIAQSDEGNLDVNSSDYWDNLGSPSDINAGDITDDGTYRLESWNNLTGIPHATPSNGDVTHLSLADEIYDWVIGLGYSTTTGTVTSIATTAPISGGTITTTGTISLATATPSNGDTTHASTADQIYDWGVSVFCALNGCTMTGNISRGDNIHDKYGSGDDACIYYNGSALIISTVAGDCA